MAKIESNVPVPERRQVKVPIRELEVGESVLFDLSDRGTVQSLASHIKRKEGKEFTVSKINDKQARVWRVR